MRKLFYVSAVLLVSMLALTGCSSKPKNVVKNQSEIYISVEGLADESAIVLEQCYDAEIAAQVYKACETDVEATGRDILARDMFGGDFWHTVGIEQEGKIVSIQQYGKVHAENVDEINFQFTLPIAEEAVVENPAGVYVSGNYYVSDGRFFFEKSDPEKDENPIFIVADIGTDGTLSFVYGNARIYMARGKRTFESYAQYMNDLNAAKGTDSSEAAKEENAD